MRVAQLEIRAPQLGRSVVVAGDEAIPIGLDADGRATWGRGRVVKIVAEVRGDMLVRDGREQRLAPGVPVDVDGVEITWRVSADAHAAALNDLGIALWTLETAEELFELALDALISVLGVRRAAIALLDDDEDGLEIHAARGGLSELNTTVARAVVESGAAILSSEAAVDGGDEEDDDDELSIDVRAILCAPLRDEGRPQGVLYVDNQGRPSIFTNDELDFAAALAHLISFAYGNFHRKAENRELKEALGLGERLILVSPSMKEIRARIEKVAVHDATVLLTGESGVGKELAALEIHRLSPRHGGPFVAVNCAAIPDTLLESELFGYAPKSAIAGADPAGRAGRFEQADGGTLFLDEIAEMKHELQAKLLRVLQDKRIDRLNDTVSREVDTRIVVATNQDLEARVSEGRFREDLYYRLNVVAITIPPLRRRREEISLLAEYFIRTYPGSADLRRAQLTSAAERALVSHSWPGNVRELKNCIEQALIMGDGKTVRLSDLPPAIRQAARRPVDESDDLETLAEIEKRQVARVLEATGWNKTRSAKILGISKPTLYAKIKAYDLTPAS